MTGLTYFFGYKLHSERLKKNCEDSSRPHQLETRDIEPSCESRKVIRESEIEEIE